eukprot:s16_g42.t1
MLLPSCVALYVMLRDTPGIPFRSHILLRSQSSALSLSIYHQLFNLLRKWIKSFVQCTVQKQLGLWTVMR